MKKFSKCKIEKEFSDFGKSTKDKCGLRSACKECLSIANKEYLLRNPEKRKITCANYQEKNREVINKKSADWYAKNKEKAALTRKNWRDRNKEKYLLDIANYQSANKEKLAIAAKIWRENNREKTVAYAQKFRSMNPEKTAEANRVWASRNRDKINAKKSRRIASKIQATPAWANAEKIKEFYFAANFLSMVTGEFQHVDHIVPLKSKYVCGLHCEANLRVLPALENLKKSNRYWPDMP